MLCYTLDMRALRFRKFAATPSAGALKRAPGCGPGKAQKYRAQVVLSYVMPKSSATALPHLRKHRKAGPDNTLPLNFDEVAPAAHDNGQGPADAGAGAQDAKVQIEAKSTQPDDTPAHIGRNRKIQAPPIRTRPTKTEIHKAKLKERMRARIHYEGPAELKARIERIARCLDVSARDAHVLVADKGALAMERMLRRKGKLP